MQHFYVRAEMGKNAARNQSEVDADYEKAALVAPYRHTRLSTMKLAGDANNPVRLSEDVSIEELRAQVMKHLTALAPVLHLEPLLAPAGGIANRDVVQDEAGQ